MYIHQYIQWNGDNVKRNGASLYHAGEQDPHEIALNIYKQMGISYPKFFKMDLLSRIAFLASELVIPETVTESKDHIATIISTTSGCLDVDKKFDESRRTHASPALFVYTLPNIMLGEICIRNGFKGEQMCTIAEDADADWFDFYIYDLLNNRNTEACLCGYAEATEHNVKATLLWVSKVPSALPFNASNLKQIFNSGI
ncbi:MAG: hypothetical protein WC756_05620 [Taibaiella sp.]